MPEEKQTNEKADAVRRVPCEVYSRIVGYLRPVRNWNDAKRQEFEDRVAFKVPEDGSPHG
ncbi:MAG: hypothetical protein GVY30_12210 [Chloroflexi bacterium]|jgi:anaerobic ribonucleoside-triphosphate reductase|nr:hypothetical protein [Chloroflexota bacterium]